MDQVKRRPAAGVSTRSAPYGTLRGLRVNVVPVPVLLRVYYLGKLVRGVRASRLGLLPGSRRVGPLGHRGQARVRQQSRGSSLRDPVRPGLLLSMLR